MTAYPIDCRQQFAGLVSPDSVYPPVQHNKFDSIEAGYIEQPSAGEPTDTPTVVPRVSNGSDLPDSGQAEAFAYGSRTKSDAHGYVGNLNCKGAEHSDAEQEKNHNDHCDRMSFDRHHQRSQEDHGDSRQHEH
jgi:hypothetical protein